MLNEELVPEMMATIREVKFLSTELKLRMNSQVAVSHSCGCQE
jgi:hypothetical protein